MNGLILGSRRGPGTELRNRGLKALMVLGFLGIASTVSAAAPTPPFTQCPAIGSDTSCAILYVFNADGTISSYGDSSQGPYDGSDDTLVGVLNQSGSVKNSLTLTGVGLSGVPIFGFESDGICTFTFTGSGYCSGTYYKSDPGDYAGPANTFSGISTDQKTGTIVFTGGLANGASTYFSLEDKLSATAPPVVVGGGTSATPLPASFFLLMVGLVCAVLYMTARNRRTA